LQNFLNAPRTQDSCFYRGLLIEMYHASLCKRRASASRHISVLYMDS